MNEPHIDGLALTETSPACSPGEGWLMDGPNIETDIVWLIQPSRFRYLREGLYATTQPTARINPFGTDPDYCVAGYACVAPRRGRGRQAYLRRFWYVKGPELTSGFFPAEATRPCMIRLNTPRADWDDNKCGFASNPCHKCPALAKALARLNPERQASGDLPDGFLLCTCGALLNDDGACDACGNSLAQIAEELTRTDERE